MQATLHYWDVFLHPALVHRGQQFAHMRFVFQAESADFSLSMRSNLK